MHSVGDTSLASKPSWTREIEGNDGTCFDLPEAALRESWRSATAAKSLIDLTPQGLVFVDVSKLTRPDSTTSVYEFCEQS